MKFLKYLSASKISTEFEHTVDIYTIVNNANVIEFNISNRFVKYVTRKSVDTDESL